MDYILSFLEGIITFISPCLLPMIPIYISYFAGQKNKSNKKLAVVNALGFILGFTFVFVVLGAFAGSFGRFLREFKEALNIIMGLIVIIFGLNYMDLIKIPFTNSSNLIAFENKKDNFLSSVIFGIVFSISWTPCVSTFLGTALMLAATKGESLKGILMLLCFSGGLGIPFLVSAVLIDRLKTSFDFIKRNYKIINFISGGLLIIIGFMMATGFLGYLISILTF